MRALLIVVLVACGGGKPPAQQPVSNATPPADAPAAKPAEPAVSDIVANMSAFKDQMCMCKDKACADHVQDDMMKWASAMAKDTKADKINEDDTKRVTELATQFSDCYAKLAAPASP